MTKAVGQQLWGGRFSGSLDPLAAQLNASLPIDHRLALQDVRGSQAWARAIHQAGILSETELGAILAGLATIQHEFEEDCFSYAPTDEDIHTAVERRLGELIGVTAGKLHTGRSRNDQVATDFRMWVMDACSQLLADLVKLQQTLIERAEQDWGAVLPGYTHFQQAQPVLYSHWWLSHFWALQRDRERLLWFLDHTRQMPLGSAALAGTAFPVDRFTLAEDLGFSGPCANSLDGVSDRDFAVEFLFWAALTGAHLSRLAEALILYSSSEYGFVTFADAYSTGSSLMPQKKNPDIMELARGRSASLLSGLVELLATLKALPSAYDKDLQGDKEPVFRAADTLCLLLPVMAGAISTLCIHGERSQAVIQPGVLATDLADFLVKKGIPFREAHHCVGSAIRRAEESHLPLSELPLAEWQAIHPAFSAELFNCFDVASSLAARSAFGGTSPDRVKEQLEIARKVLS